jgi:hypothetical protein
VFSTPTAQIEAKHLFPTPNRWWAVWLDLDLVDHGGEQLLRGETPDADSPIAQREMDVFDTRDNISNISRTV